MAYLVAARTKFFHGQAPEAEVSALAHAVGDSLVVNALLVEEATRRGIKPDAAVVKKSLEDFEQAQRNNEQWQKVRAAELPRVVRGLEEGTLAVQLNEQVLDSILGPSIEQERAYYAEHLDKFTEPEQVRISVILLKVDPAAGQAARDKATEEAQGIAKSLRAGASFAETARLRSADSSAPEGGDMGYLHKGMLPATVQEVVGKLKPGTLSDPFNVLDGVAIIHFDAVKAAQVKAFEAVRPRLAVLWKRDETERVWNEFIAKLRAKATIQVNESQYPAAGVAKSEKSEKSEK